MDMTYAIRVPAAVCDPHPRPLAVLLTASFQLALMKPLILDLVVLKPAAK
jgi:hypothetical protein